MPGGVHRSIQPLVSAWALLPVEGGDVLVPAEVYAGGREIQVPRWQAWARVAREKLQRLMEDAA